MADDRVEHKQKIIQFSPLVTTGNMITLVMLLITLALQWGALSTRMDASEKRLDSTDSAVMSLKAELVAIGKSVVKVEVLQEQQTKVLERIAVASEKERR